MLPGLCAQAQGDRLPPGWTDRTPTSPAFLPAAFLGSGLSAPLHGPWEDEVFGESVTPDVYGKGRGGTGGRDGQGDGRGTKIALL